MADSFRFYGSFTLRARPGLVNALGREAAVSRARRPPGLAARRGVPQDTALTLADGDPLGVEIFHEGNGVLAAHPEEILHVRGTDVLLLPEVRHELVADLLQSRRVEEERLLDPEQPAVGHEDL